MSDLDGYPKVEIIETSNGRFVMVVNGENIAAYKRDEIAGAILDELGIPFPQPPEGK